jgi:16S rRNA (adenine1518-N6/adenine1519-N6)-dimethyltransferase
MTRVRPKKYLGQHFLNDRTIAERISGSLTGEGYRFLLEIGPGMGILTGYLIERGFNDFRVVEIDEESVHYLKKKFEGLRTISGDFLDLDLDTLFPEKLAVIGNFPYNISSQIFFRILKYKNKVEEVCCMLQEEVARRICAGPGSRTYGILSVLLQAYYSAEYLFSVPADVFSPQPKVQSGVIRLRRNGILKLDCDEELFFKVVKACFNQRRKILRNSVRAAFTLKNYDYDELYLRPEQLSVDQFVRLTSWIENNRM